MSLLFDALKRAQKSDARVERGADPQCLDLSGSLAAIRPSAALAEGRPDLEIGAFAAQAIFSATARQSTRTISLAAGGILLLLVAGYGGYWYYQRATASPAIAIATPVAAPAGLAAPSQTAAPPPVDTVVPDVTLPVAVRTEGTAGNPRQPPAETIGNSDEQSPAVLVPIMAKRHGEGGPSSKNDRSPRRSARRVEPREQAGHDSAPPPTVVDNPAESHVRLNVSRDPLREGYQALTEGRMDDAERLYQEVIAKQPHERDALLGLAVIAHRQQQSARALELYRQVLREDPDNPTATSALITLSEQVDPVEAETRIKQLLDQKPTSPELHHALGSLLARQKRWGEAQQSFFRAYNLDQGNAQYAYNLAVALDHLHKPSAALSYYEKSANILKPGDVAIDRDTLQLRVQELRGTPQEHR